MGARLHSLRESRLAKADTLCRRNSRVIRSLSPLKAISWISRERAPLPLGVKLKDVPFRTCKKEARLLTQDPRTVVFLVAGMRRVSGADAQLLSLARGRPRHPGERDRSVSCLRLTVGVAVREGRTGIGSAILAAVARAVIRRRTLHRRAGSITATRRGLVVVWRLLIDHVRSRDRRTPHSR